MRLHKLWCASEPLACKNSHVLEVNFAVSIEVSIALTLAADIDGPVGIGRYNLITEHARRASAGATRLNGLAAGLHTQMLASLQDNCRYYR